MVESCPREYVDKPGLIEAKKKMEEVVSALEGDACEVARNQECTDSRPLQISCLSKTRSFVCWSSRALSTGTGGSTKLWLATLRVANRPRREPKLVLSVPERMLLFDGTAWCVCARASMSLTDPQVCSLARRFKLAAQASTTWYAACRNVYIRVGLTRFTLQIALKNLRNFHVYLCSDILLVVEEREKKGQRRDYLHHVVGLAYAAVIPVAGKPAFQILQPRQDFKYLFRAANSEAKGALWCFCSETRLG